MPDLRVDRSPVELEHLEAENEALRAQLAKVTGEARKREDEALYVLLGAVRTCVSELETDSPWRIPLLRVAFDVARQIGEGSSLEETIEGTRVASFIPRSQWRSPAKPSPQPRKVRRVSKRGVGQTKREAA